MATLNKDVFGLKVENHELVKLAYDAYLANSRSSHAKTLKRVKYVVAAKSLGSKKGLVELDSVLLETQFGDMVAWLLGELVTKTSPRRSASKLNAKQFAKRFQ